MRHFRVTISAQWHVAVVETKMNTFRNEWMNWMYLSVDATEGTKRTNGSAPMAAVKCVPLWQHKMKYWFIIWITYGDKAIFETNEAKILGAKVIRWSCPERCAIVFCFSILKSESFIFNYSCETFERFVLRSNVGLLSSASRRPRAHFAEMIMRAHCIISYHIYTRNM